LGGAIERHRRHVDPGHLPAPGRQPDGIAALAAAHVQGRSRLEAGDLLDQAEIGFPALQISGFDR
jgi:hypothetical protein